MNKNKKVLVIFVLIVVLAIAFSVVARMVDKNYIQPRKMAAIVPNVEVTTLKTSDIYDKLTSSGRLEGKYSVDVVARVSGWLKQSYFQEGAKVKKGALLFLIEPDNYQIAVNQALANLKKAQADYVNAAKDLTRADELVKLDYVSKSYYDQALSKRDMTKAAVDASKAALSKAQLDLSYTRVKSPVDGKVGKILITQGNYVTSTVGTITKIISLDPIYASFNLKSEDYLKYQKNSPQKLKDSTVQLTLADGSVYDELGSIEFVDNQVNPSTGTIALRATFSNSKDILVPSDFVNVLIQSKTPRRVLLLPQEATMETKQGMMVYKVENNIAIPAIIEANEQVDGKWVVSSGLKEGDVVIVQGIANLALRPNSKVNIVQPKNNATSEQSPEKKK